MIIFTIGFTQLSAEDFFSRLKESKVEILIDIRLNNTSQLAGFSKGDDLKFFLKELCNIGYSHEVMFAPSKEILDDYKKKKIDWAEYVRRYIALITQRDFLKLFNNKYKKYSRICFLCSEPVSNMCHRRLLAEEISNADPTTIIEHL